MNRIILTMFLLIFINIIYALPDGDSKFQIVECVRKIEGNVDSSACLQSILNMKGESGGTINIPAGVYTVNKTLVVPSNITINAAGVTIKPNFSTPNSPVFILHGVKNVTIKDVKILGDGKFSTQMVQNKYDDKSKSIGFSNRDYGIIINGNSNNITIKNSKLSGIEYGIIVEGNIKNRKPIIDNVFILNNSFTNIGMAGIRIVNAKNIQIKNNIIYDISGNFSSGLKPIVSDSRFGDGIYLAGAKNSTISNNIIYNVIRIGIVLEVSLDENKILFPNDGITISNNYIRKVQNSRGTEGNGGIWIEGGNANAKGDIVNISLGVKINDNIIDNQGALPGAHMQFGILDGAKSAIIRNNKIFNFNNFNNYGIYCKQRSLLESNVVYGNYNGVFVNSGKNNISYKNNIILNNNILDNKRDVIINEK